VPHIPQVFNDEYNYKNAAENLAESQQLSLCLSQINNKCEDYVFTYWPPGHSFLASFFILLLGKKLVFYLTSIMGVLSVVLIFFFTYLLFKKEIVSLISSLILATFPLHLKFSGNFSSEIYSSFFLMMSISFLFVYLREKSFRVASLVLITLLFSLQFRFENIFFLIVFVLFWVLHFQLLIFSKKFFLPLFFIFTIFLLPIFLNFFIHGIHHDVPKRLLLETAFPRFFNTFLSNSFFFFGYEYFFNILILFSILGAVWGFQREKKITILFLSWIIIFFLFYSFYGGNFFIGSQSRFLINFIIPIIILSGLGFYYVCNLFSNRNLKRVLYFIIIFYFLILPFVNYSFINKKTINQEEHYFLLSLRNKISSNCLIFSEHPTVIITTLHQDSTNMNKLYEKKFLRRVNLSCLIMYNYLDSATYFDLIQNISFFNISPYENLGEEASKYFYKVDIK